MKDYKTIEINYDDSNNLDLEYIKSLCDDDILYVNIRQKYTTDETVYIKKLNMLVFKHYQKFSIYKVYTKHFNIIPTNDYIIVDENDILTKISYNSSFSNYKIFRMLKNDSDIILNHGYFILIDMNNDIVLDDDIVMYYIKNDKLYTQSKNNKIQIYDKDLIPQFKDDIFNTVDVMVKDLGYFIVKNKYDKKGIIDLDGNILLDFEYDTIQINSRNPKDISAYKNRIQLNIDDLIENQKLQHNLNIINESL